MLVATAFTCGHHKESVQKATAARTAAIRIFWRRDIVLLPWRAVSGVLSQSRTRHRIRRAGDARYVLRNRFAHLARTEYIIRVRLIVGSKCGCLALHRA